MLKTKCLFSLLLLFALFIVQTGYAQDDTAAQEAVPPQEEEAQEAAPLQDAPLIQEEEVLFDENKVVLEKIANAQAMADSLLAEEDKRIAEMEEKSFKPDPKKALLYSIVPGLGQIYNRKYWKLPIIYGGFIGCVYSVTWNNNSWKDYSAAYKELALLPADQKDEAKLWLAFVTGSTNLSAFGGAGAVETYLKNNKDNFRRYRDLSIIITIALYFLSYIDAYVDAQLYDFDITPDLGMRIEPVIINRTVGNAQSYGLQCNIKF